MIKFRPHHFMCTLSFQGKGYSADFVRNYKKIVEVLQNNEDTPIEVVYTLDSVCEKCPRQAPENQCTKQSLIDKLDDAHEAALMLKQDNVKTLTWRQAKKRIKEKMTVEKFHQACQGCQWKDYGVCELILKQLLDNPI